MLTFNVEMLLFLRFLLFAVVVEEGAFWEFLCLFVFGCKGLVNCFAIVVALCCSRCCCWYCCCRCASLRLALVLLSLMTIFTWPLIDFTWPKIWRRILQNRRGMEILPHFRPTAMIVLLWNNILYVNVSKLTPSLTQMTKLWQSWSMKYSQLARSQDCSNPRTLESPRPTQHFTTSIFLSFSAALRKNSEQRPLEYHLWTVPKNFRFCHPILRIGTHLFWNPLAQWMD